MRLVLAVGPALRFSHVFDRREPNSRRKDSPNTRTSMILVAAPIGYTDSFELVHKTIEALLQADGIHVLIKFHPKMAARRSGLVASVLDSLGISRLPDHFEITDEAIFELLPSIDLLLYNATAVFYEALAWGLPVLLVQSDIWFDIDSLPSDSELVTAARTPEEIRRTVHLLLSEDDMAGRRRQQQVQSLLKEEFCPIREDTVRVFLTGVTGEVA